MAKKRISAEERREYKGGRYMGGPAEERAEKTAKRARQSMAGYGGLPGFKRAKPAKKGK